MLETIKRVTQMLGQGVVQKKAGWAEKAEKVVCNFIGEVAVNFVGQVYRLSKGLKATLPVLKHKYIE